MYTDKLYSLRLIKYKKNSLDKSKILCNARNTLFCDCDKECALKPIANQCMQLPHLLLKSSHLQATTFPSQRYMNRQLTCQALTLEDEVITQLDDTFFPL